MQPTRIAIATIDGVSVCDHLAHSSGFVIVEVDGSSIQPAGFRQRANGPCGHHASFVELLAGCQAVICGGIGQGAADALLAHGIEPLVLEAALSIDDTVKAWLTGTLKTTAIRVCLCE